MKMEVKVLSGCVLVSLIGLVTCQTTNATVQVNINNTLQGDNQNKPQSTLNTIQSTHLQCYDCSPMHNPEGCEDPENAVIPPRVSLCKNQDKEPNVTLTCISTFIHVPESRNLTGIYRGCGIVKQDVQDFCDWYKEELSVGNLSTIPAYVKSCTACNNTRCNVNRFKADGSSNAKRNNSIALILNLIIFVLLNSSSIFYLE